MLQRKNLNILDLLKRKRVASVPQREQFARAAFAKRKRNRAVCPKHQIVRRAFSVREVKRAAAEKIERDEYSSAEEQLESKCKAKSSQRAF